MTAHNKPLAYMAADVNTLTPVLRKNVSDYPQYSLLDAATNAIAKTLAVIKKVIIKLHIKMFFCIFTA